jgi:hypothetical protein
VESDSKELIHGCKEEDVKSMLDHLIRDAGKVVMEYGGFSITVLDKSKFPWKETFDMLVGDCFEVWLNRKDPHLVIVAKQRVD